MANDMNDMACPGGCNFPVDECQCNSEENCNARAAEQERRTTAFSLPDRESRQEQRQEQRRQRWNEQRFPEMLPGKLEGNCEVHATLLPGGGWATSFGIVTSVGGLEHVIKERGAGMMRRTRLWKRDNVGVKAVLEFSRGGNIAIHVWEAWSVKSIITKG